ncbi:MAG: hypothetical protein BGO95_08750 [Micrococcales bacterium 73-13]|nr:MAG: hypothetical protein BGO95_08750 [Micrococcales bacterium 73-13]
MTTAYADPTPRSLHDNLLLGAEDHFSLAAFGFNNRGGMWFSTAEETPRATWEETKALALAAEAAGFEALVPNARWKGFGGSSDYNLWSLEAIPWAAGLAEATSRIHIFATVHAPTIHPVRMAKQAATIDHISGGRFGLNVVAGWNPAEMAMFGREVQDHPDRYAFATEWMDLVERLWTSPGEFDYAGRYFTAEGAISIPHPVQSPRPVVMNAAISETGRRFAARFADINFMVSDDPEDVSAYVTGIKRLAREEFDRDINVMTQIGIIIGETEADARKRLDHWLKDLGDWEAVRRFANMNLETAPDFAFDSKEMRVAMGHHSAPLVGTPEQIVEKIAMFKKAGISGAAVNWVDYAEGIRQYDELLRPLLVDAGLRRF